MFNIYLISAPVNMCGRENERQRNVTRIRAVAGGAIYIGGVIGMKIVGDPIPADSLAYYMSTMAEEGMEMLGVVLFLYAQLRYMTGGRSEVGRSLCRACLTPLVVGLFSIFRTTYFPKWVI